MQQNLQKKFIIRILLVFVVVTGLTFGFAGWLDSKKIDHIVVAVANTLLFLLTCTSLLLHIKAAANPNPNVFVRSVMGATFIKLMSIIVALAIYLFTAGPGKSIYGVFVGLGLYIIYTITEVKAVLQLNKRKDGGN